MLLKSRTNLNFSCFYIQLWVWTVLHLEIKSVNNCAFRLSGLGNKEFEGFIEVRDMTGEWYNVCGAVDKTEMCYKLTYRSLKPVLQHPKAFNGKLQRYAIRLDGSFAKQIDDNCVFNKTEKPCQNGSDNECCEPVWICCNDDTLGEHCSKNWSGTFNESCYSKLEGKRLSYAEARNKSFDEDGMKNRQLAWTKSTLVGVVEKNCKEVDSPSRDKVRDCSNHCLNSDKFSNVHIYSGGDCRCNHNSLIQQNERECYKELKVVNNKKETPVLCIAVEVKNGRKTFKAEDCDRLLQPYCAKLKNKDDNNTTTSPTLRPHVGESEDVLMPSIIVFVSIAVIAVLVAIICRWSRKKTRNDPLRHNAMYNRTYDRQMPKNDEEYAIISEIELDSGVSVYKPPLPERSASGPDGNTYNVINFRNDTEAGAVVTLDDYSTPSDMIRDTTDFDLAAEYSTTYDDPIRHNAGMPEETKYKCDNKENDAIDKHVSEANLDKRSSLCGTFQNENVLSKSYECLTCSKIETGNSKSCPESGETNDDDKLGPNKITETNHSQRSTLIEKSMTKTDGNFESFTPSSISVSRTVEQPSEYEDTNLIDGNFPSKSKKSVNEEHICLHCLKPEHLKKLGIKLIPDKNLDDSEKRLSEPLRIVYGDVTETSRNLRRCKTDVTETDSQYNLINLKGTFRKCVECQHVYDHLGNFKDTDDVNSKRNEYNHIQTVTKEKYEDS